MHAAEATVTKHFYFPYRQMLLVLLRLRAGAKQTAEATVVKNCSFPDRLMLLIKRAGPKQAAKGTVAEHFSFPDQTDVASVSDVENRSQAGSRGNCF